MKQSKLKQLVIELDEAQSEYLAQCAEKRGISSTHMGRVVVLAVLDLKLIDDTLDDEGKTYENKWGQHGKRKPRAVAAPAPKPLFERGGAISSRGQAPSINYRRPVVQTRGEIRQDFHDAARHTAALSQPSPEEVQRMTPEQVRGLLESRRGMTFDDTHLGRHSMFGHGQPEGER